MHNPYTRPLHAPHPPSPTLTLTYPSQVGVVYVEHNSLHRWNHIFNFFCLALFYLTFASVGGHHLIHPNPSFCLAPFYPP